MHLCSTVEQLNFALAEKYCIAVHPQPNGEDFSQDILLGDLAEISFPPIVKKKRFTREKALANRGLFARLFPKLFTQ